MTKRQKFFSALGQFFKSVFTKNIPIKIAALVFALLLWGYVLSEEKPKYVKRVTDVSIDYQNESRLKGKGWEVVEISPSTVDVNVEAGIDMHSMLDASRVRCYVDLGSITISDQDPDRKTVEVGIMTSIPEYGVLKNTSTERAKVTIERVKVSERMTASVQLEGSLPAIVKMNDTLPEYFECIPPKKVTVSQITGLKSDIDRISGAEVTIDLSSFDNDDLSKVTGTFSRILPVTFRDASGEVIVSNATDGVVVNVEDIVIRRYKEVPIKLSISEEQIDTDVYEYICEIKRGETDTVRIYGDASELAKVTEIETELIYPESQEGRTAVKAELLYPEDADITMERDSVNVVVATKKRTVDGAEYEIQVKYSNPDNGMKLAEKTETIKVRVSGLVDAMNAFNPDWLTASVDLARCGQGKQNLPFKLLFKGVDLYAESYLVRETDNEDEPAIRITYVTKNGETYQIELVSNTVEVVLNSTETETNG